MPTTRVAMPTAPHRSPLHAQQSAAPPLWDSATGRFAPALLRNALVVRGMTPEAFALEAKCGRSSVYKALSGAGVSDRTAIEILRGLGRLEPCLSNSG